MGKITKPRPVKLISGVIASDAAIFESSEKVLQKVFGHIDYMSQIIDFDFTHYYKKEMGNGLRRRFISFKRLIDPSELVKIKLTTNRIEGSFAKKIRTVNRPINIDPGYINDAKVVLATTKDYSHRVYLSKGVYSEVTLYYKDYKFNPWPWSYPDYRTKEYIDIFNHIRNLYMQQINI